MIVLFVRCIAASEASTRRRAMRRRKGGLRNVTGEALSCVVSAIALVDEQNG